MSEPIDRGQAGRSARREYDRRKAHREERLRSQYGAIGGVAARISSEPQHTISLLQGEAGEVKAAAGLVRRLKDKGVILLHDRAIPGSRANIDHIAVGPGGITVIDAKAVTGRTRVETRGGLLSKKTQRLIVGGRDKTKLIEGVERQVDLVREVFGDYDIRGALCWMKFDGLPLIGTVEMRGIRVDGPKPIAKIAARPGGLSAADVNDLALRLANHFPPA